MVGPAAAMLLGVAAATAGAPPETGARLERALEALEKGFVGSYTTTVRAVVEKPNGKDRQESLLVVATTRRADGTSEDRLVKRLENGKDVTEQERAEAARATPRPAETPGAGPRDRGAGKDRKGGETGADLKLPTGNDAALYRFTAPVEEDGLIVVAYEPLPGHRGDDGMATGRLAWRRDTLDPVWFEAEMVSLPTAVSALAMRFEFDRLGDLLYAKTTSTKGAGGILWIKRRFEAQIEVGDVVPAPVVTPTAGTADR